MKKNVHEKRRVLAILLVFAFVIQAFTPMQIFGAETSEQGSYSLVNMTFSEVKTLPYSDSSTGITATLERESSTANGTVGYGTSSLNSTEWAGEEAYWQISFSTKNFKELTFDASLRSSGTAPKNFKVAYSVDGTNFVDLTETIEVTNKLTPITTVSLPELANDQDKVVIRVYRADKVNVKGTEVEAAGVSNINGIVVKGTSIDGTLPEVSIEPSPEVTVQPTTEPTESTTPEPVVYNDPISDSDIPEGAVTIPQAYETADATEVTVVGQIQYRYGKNGGENTTIIEDVIDGEVYGFQVYNALSDNKVGDVVAVTGTLSTYGGVKQLGSITSVTKIKDAELIGPQEVTIEQLLTDGATYLSEYVVLRDVTLGTYSTSNTPITDAVGKSINIYQASAYPEDLEAGSQAHVYAVYSKYNTTGQLRTGKTENTYKIIGYDVESSIVTELAKWAGTGQFEGNIAYGDLYAENDFLDTSASITLSTGEKPQYVSVNGTEYYIGSTGLPLGEYYQLEFSSDKYADMDLSFKLRSSNSGPKYYEVLYSTDGVNFTKSENISYTINTTVYVDGVGTPTSKSYSNMSKLEATTAYQTYNVALPDTIADAEKVYIRLQVATENSRIDGKLPAIGSAYTCRLTNISVTGSPIVSSNICRIVTAEPDADSVALGTEVTLSCATNGATIYYSINGADYAQYDETNKPVLTELPAIVTVYASMEGKEDSVKTTYAYTQAQVATVKGSPNGGAVKLNNEVKLSCDTEDATIYYSVNDGETYQEYKEPIKLTELPCSIKTYATKEGFVTSETRTLSFTERANENYNVYFGQLHSHTNYSDGAGTAEDAFKHASTEVDNLDFLAVTDHSNYFDNDTLATISDGSVSTEWVEGNALADKYTNDKFVGLFGYEMTWSGGAPGHMNTFNTGGFLSRNMTGYGNGSSSSLVNYYASLKTVPDSISQFNHPGTTFGDFYDFGYYDAEIDQLITTIEVGNGEGAVGSSGYFPSYEYYTRALDKGWHVAPTNNQDNHKGYWGSANTARTVVLADSLTRDNIYDALRNMRAYATEDSNLSIQYTLNDEIMGTILEETPDSVNIAVSLSDADKTDTIGKVEVIVNGGLSVASKTITTNSADLTFTLSPDYSYYYIKVTQGDGDIAVTAPVWISDVDAAGVSSVSTSSSIQIKNEAVDITAEFYNNNEHDVEITSVEFSAGDETFFILEGEALAAAGLTTLASKTSGKYTLDFVHDGIGATTVTVKMNAVAKGVTKVYTNKLVLNYVPRDMVNKIIVDGTHFNDYVTGYYAGNIKEIGKLGASYYEEVVVKKDTITAEDLADCALLVVSAPAKRTGTNTDGVAYGPTNYSDEFITLVSNYVKNGGQVILCGIADYNDNATTQTSTELNKLLEAMGATTRVNSDELVDDDKNGGQNYRLYFDDYNMSSKYLDGFIEGMEYSAYSSCGILLDETAVAAGTAEAIVYGHDTTYNINTKEHGGNFVEQEKGSIVALATESVGENGGRIWVGGTIFLSDFEIDEELKQNADELSYANTLIVGNILKDIQKEKVVTDIATVRKADMGEIFTIEGYVTVGTTDVATTFFDSIYVQDDTAGIDIFPFSKQGVEIGQKIQITGYVDEYQGDKELMVMSYKLLDGSKVYEPLKITTKQATDYDTFGGSLVKVTGKVTKVDYAGDVLNYIHIQDASGVTCKVLTDGYIGSSTGVDNTSQIVKVGNTISAVGVLYMNPEGVCIRNRDRAEIVLVQSASVDPITSKITYYLRGGKNAAKNPSTYVEGKAVKLANPTKTGYTFAGWYTDANYKNKLASNTISEKQTGDVKVYAKWTANKYTIKFAKNSTKAKGSMKSITATYNKSVKLTKVGFTRKGYLFSGWAKTKNGKVVYKNTASVKNLTATNGKTVTLYAKWTKVSVGQTKSLSLKASGNGKVKASWKSAKGAGAYQIVYSTNSNFKNAKSTTVSSKKLSTTLSNLKAGKTYYVKVRAYKKDSQGNKVYGKYCKVKKITVPKKK